MLKRLWKRGKIAPEDIHNILLPDARFLFKQGSDFLFEISGYITEVEITRVDCTFLPFPSRSAIGGASHSRARGPGFDTRSGHILSFLFPLIQKGKLLFIGESMCTKY